MTAYRGKYPNNIRRTRCGRDRIVHIYTMAGEHFTCTVAHARTVNPEYMPSPGDDSTPYRMPDPDITDAFKAAHFAPIAAPEPVHVPATAGNVARINVRGTSHLYRMGTDRGPLDCEANTRTQAAALAKRFGYIVNDCNMIG